MDTLRTFRDFSARVRVQSKLIRRSLNTTVLSVAKLRLSDFEKSQRQAAESQTEAKRGKMLFSEAVKVPRSRIEADASLKPRSQSYYDQRIVALLRSRPGLEQRDVRTLTQSDRLDWAAQFTRQGEITVRGEADTGTKNSEVRKLPMITDMMSLLNRLR